MSEEGFDFSRLEISRRGWVPTRLVIAVAVGVWTHCPYILVHYYCPKIKAAGPCITCIRSLMSLPSGRFSAPHPQHGLNAWTPAPLWFELWSMNLCGIGVLRPCGFIIVSSEGDNRGIPLITLDSVWTLSQNTHRTLWCTPSHSTRLKRSGDLLWSK